MPADAPPNPPTTPVAAEAFGSRAHFGFDDMPEDLSSEDMLAWLEAHPPPPPSAEVLAKVKAATEAVQAVLDPNRFSDIKRVRSSFSLPSVLVRLGEAKKFECHGLALPTFRTNMLRCNAPAPGFFYITNILTANVLATVGVPTSKWPRDGWTENVEEAIKKGEPCMVTDDIGFNPERHTDHGCWLDAYGDHPFELPTLSKTTRVTIEGVYTGDVPPGYRERDFMFTMTFFGNASLV
jgi:hypothetical protein